MARARPRVRRLGGDADQRVPVGATDLDLDDLAHERRGACRLDVDDLAPVGPALHQAARASQLD